MQANKVKALSAHLEGMKTHMKPKEVKVKIPKGKGAVLGGDSKCICC